MPARLSQIVVGGTIAILAALAACRSDAVGPSSADPITNPIGLLNVGDALTLNVNGNDPCDNAVYHGTRVVAVGTRSIVFADTLNPKNGFTTADFQRFAARFDSLVYPLDVANFGDPTDIDKNGRISIVFTRAVNELTAAHANSYVGGFAFSRDLFPADVANAQAQACKGSNQGEYFYALAPDPTGSINGNVRTTGFVDSVTTSVLAHELQHIINSSRRLYVNNAHVFEDRWLDEGLAHVAEELLFYRESGLTPLANLDINKIRATSAIRVAFNSDMSGNAGRYKTYLAAPYANSPYAADDSLGTRGAAWSFLRYSLDRANATDGFTAGDGQVVAGSGTVSVAAGASSNDFTAIVVNTGQVAGSVGTFTMKTSTLGGISTPLIAAAPAASLVMQGNLPSGLVRDEAFESRLRDRERAVLTPMMPSAQAWYASHVLPEPSLLRAPSSVSSLAADDATLLFKLVNSTSKGLDNFSTVFGPDVAGLVRDWSVSHAVDDVASLTTQYQQRSWNWHNLYPNLTAPIGQYPLAVTTIGTNTSVTSSSVAGGSVFYKFTVPANSSATVNLAAANATTVMVVVKTR